ncbi:MAG: methylenetetrahydrofolate dehydrogenase / methenyltetrahydrofolate cyclohydrolase [Acidimicrobiaceae bacterium]|nr:methylenetetrahydrofolate dehydrogenase / methenyltetrahydrofolate cyclohydrolase [Acidimicrobiaceae bacterium]MDQ1442307.1 methylenetetrahydrofolate dehydrogenase / methenyltetrahydrofolate cyclohydrolase [Acidimicrobiaceae bacterium]
MPGGPVADAVYAEVGERVKVLAAAGTTVGLGTIQVGDDSASAGYIAKKHEMCARYGLVSLHQHIPADASQADLLAAVATFNADPAVDAFLIQNPVPPGFNFNAAMLAVDPDKDADGLHPVNLGVLALGARGPRPCTPAGIQALLAYYEVPVEGRNVVIVGRGPTLGRPLSLLLALKEPHANAAVTVVHTGVKDWAEYTRRADIVVGAAGVANMITPDVIRPGAAVVGGGITWEGRRLLSDVDESCAEVAGWITPRLGGVGVTTVALLLRNTVDCAERRASR